MSTEIWIGLMLVWNAAATIYAVRGDRIIKTFRALQMSDHDNIRKLLAEIDKHKASAEYLSKELHQLDTYARSLEEKLGIDPQKDGEEHARELKARIATPSE